MSTNINSSFIRRLTRKPLFKKLVENELADSIVTVYQRKTILTHEQIKALPTTYIELVPAPGAGRALMLQNALLNAKFTGGYTNKDTNLIVFVGHGDWETEASNLGTIAANNYIQFLGHITVKNDLPDWTEDYRNGSPVLTTTYFENKPLKLCASNGLSGDLTGGNASNTLEVTVFYSIVDL